MNTEIEALRTERDELMAQNIILHTTNVNLQDELAKTRTAAKMGLDQLICNTTNMNKGMSKSIQKLCARDNKDTITALRGALNQGEKE